MNRLIFVLAAALGATGLQAQTTGDAAAPLVLDISLSPSGSKIAYLAAVGQSTEAVYVAELIEGGGASKPILVHPDEASELRYCHWATEDRLVCRIDFTRDNEGDPQDFSRLFAMSGSGQEFVALTAEDIRSGPGPAQSGGTVLALGDKLVMTRNWVPLFVTSTRVSQDDTGLGVEEVDLANGKRRTIEQPDPSIAGYAADDTGKVRFKVGQSFGPGGPGERSYSYRDAQSDRWREMTVTDAAGNTPVFHPVAVDAAKNVVYGFVDRDGHKVAASLTLKDQVKLEILLHRAVADVGGFVAIGRRQHVVGAAYAGENGEVAYFDESLRGLVPGLRQALPGHPPIAIAGSSADGNRLLIVARGESGTAMTYLFERDTRQLSEVMPVRVRAGQTMDGI